MKKKTIGIVLSAVLVVLVTVVVYAAAGGYGMTYLPGTADNVTNMPAGDNGIGGQAYGVSAMVPQREGYEFLGWTLDYGVANTYTLNYVVFGDPTYGKPGDVVEPGEVTDIREGSTVTLVDPLTTAWDSPDGQPWPVEYRVNYLELGTDRMLAPQKVVGNQVVGTTVTEDAIDIDGYVVVGASEQEITINQETVGVWTFTGWCSDEACTVPITEVENITADTTVYGQWRYESFNIASNEITFYYERMPEIKFTDYIVMYIDIDTNEKIIPDAIREHIEVGSEITEYAPDIPGFVVLNPVITFTKSDETDIIVFLYYYYYHYDD